MVYQSIIVSQGWQHHIGFLHVMFRLHPRCLSLGNSLVEAPDMFIVSRAWVYILSKVLNPEILSFLPKTSKFSPKIPLKVQNFLKTTFYAFVIIM